MTTKVALLEAPKQKDKETNFEDYDLLFVYGTLKKGYPLHSTFSHLDAMLIGPYETEKNYTMYDLGSYPAVTVGGLASIKGEIYAIKSITPFDLVEGYPNLYNRCKIHTPYGDAWMYIMPPMKLLSYKSRRILKNGEWLK